MKNKEVHIYDWKLLEVDNLPSDILTGDYEFEFYNIDHWAPAANWNIPKRQGDMIQMLVDGAFKYRYRKRKPSAEEMAEKYIKDKCTPLEYNDTVFTHADLRESYIAGYKAGKDEQTTD